MTIKQYAFWKTPWGKPYKGKDESSEAQDDHKHIPSELIKKIIENAAVSAEGKVVWLPIVGSPMLETAVRSTLVIYGEAGQVLDEGTSWSLFTKALSNLIEKAGKRKHIPIPDIMKEVNSVVAEHLRQAPQDFILKSSLSIRELPAKCITVNGCDIRSCDDTAKFKHPESLDNYLRHTKSDFAGGYHVVTVATKGRSKTEAIDTSLTALHVLRGVWTLFATHGSWRIPLMSSPSTQKPVGVIHSGQFHTLHNADGSSATHMYWFEVATGENTKIFHPKDDWKALEKKRRWALKKLATHPFKTEMESLLVRYVSALDHVDYDVAFLKLWSLLETITGTDQYDQTIKRATWFFGHRRYYRQVLESLRVRRNQYVHAAQQGEGGEYVLYMIKEFIDPHLYRLLRNSFNVSSLHDYGEFLSLPADHDGITKRKRQTDKAARWIKKHVKE
ncbi:hypothetical protein [Anatilimnocola floriformis]|uniref:hypothetical protein n=1 Tax=Anatilimnocola floriformis TaxID=2948575 RepID=UPI0020C44EA9|nr:hypothetical protein [Anatilimnocola floriformis]